MTRLLERSGISAAVATMVLLAAPGCGAAQLAGSEWRPTSLAGAEMPQANEIFVRFEGGGRLAGHGGCNGFAGTYEVTGNRIEIAPIGATRRACQDPVGLNEALLFEALSKARRFQRNRIEMSLFDDTGAMLAELKQTDAD